MAWWWQWPSRAGCPVEPPISLAHPGHRVSAPGGKRQGTGTGSVRPVGRREAQGRHGCVPVTSERKSPRVSKPALEPGQDAPSPRKQLAVWLPRGHPLVTGQTRGGRGHRTLQGTHTAHGGRQDTSPAPRAPLAHVAARTLLTRLWPHTHGATVTPAGPPSSRKPPTPPVAPVASAGQTSGRAAEAAQPPCRVSCSPGMLWAEPPGSALTTTRPGAAFPKPSCEAGAAAGKRGDPHTRAPRGPRHRSGSRRI